MGCGLGNRWSVEAPGRGRPSQNPGGGPQPPPPAARFHLPQSPVLLREAHKGKSVSGPKPTPTQPCPSRAWRPLGEPRDSGAGWALGESNNPENPKGGGTSALNISGRGCWEGGAPGRPLMASSSSQVQRPLLSTHPWGGPLRARLSSGLGKTARL